MKCNLRKILAVVVVIALGIVAYAYFTADDSAAEQQSGSGTPDDPYYMEVLTSTEVFGKSVLTGGTVVNIDFQYDEYVIVSGSGCITTPQLSGGVLSFETTTQEGLVAMRVLGDGLNQGYFFYVTGVVPSYTQVTLNYNMPGMFDLQVLVPDTMGVFLPYIEIGVDYIDFWEASDGNVYDAEEIVVVSSSETFQANWSSSDPPAGTYTVTFDSQGGNACANQTVNQGSSVTLPSTSKAGHTFLGWYTRPSSGGVKAGNAGATYTPMGNMVLFARWQVVQHTVAFNANGGTACDSVTVNAGSSIVLPDTSRSGYTLKGWYTALSGGTKRGDAGASFTPTGDTTLYAQWTQVPQYTVTYYTAGTSCSSMTVNAGSPVTLPTTSLEGSIFDGWYTALSGGSKAGNAGESYTPTGDVTLYARWTQDTWEVKYNGNGGTSPSAVNVDKGSSTILPNTTRAGHVLRGWYTSASTGVKVGDAGESYTPTGNVVLHAQWDYVQYTVSFDSRGGSVCGALTVNHGGSVILPNSTKAGHTLDGWYTSVTGGSKAGNAGANYSPTGDVTLYARWSENPIIQHTVVFNANGGTACASVTVEDGGSITLPVSTRAGYTHNGWYTALTDGSKVGNAGSSYTPTGNVTLYARWTADVPDLAFTSPDPIDVIGGDQFSYQPGTNISATISLVEGPAWLSMQGEYVKGTVPQYETPVTVPFKLKAVAGSQTVYQNCSFEAYPRLDVTAIVAENVKSIPAYYTQFFFQSNHAKNAQLSVTKPGGYFVSEVSGENGSFGYKYLFPESLQGTTQTLTFKFKALDWAEQEITYVHNVECGKMPTVTVTPQEIVSGRNVTLGATVEANEGGITNVYVQNVPWLVYQNGEFVGTAPHVENDTELPIKVVFTDVWSGLQVMSDNGVFVHVPKLSYTTVPEVSMIIREVFTTGYGDGDGIVPMYPILGSVAAMSFQSYSFTDFFDESVQRFSGKHIQFIYTGEGADTLLWEFGDGESSEEWSPTHKYEKDGFYTVRLTATNEHGSSVIEERIQIGYGFDAPGWLSIVGIAVVCVLFGALIMKARGGGRRYYR